MKSIEQIKEEYFKELGYEDLEHAVIEIAIGKSKIASATILEKHFSKIAQRYAEEYAREALRLASESVNVKVVGAGYIVIDKQSILNESNLPKHE